MKFKLTPCYAIAVVAALAAGPLCADEPTPVAGDDTLIKPLLAQKIDDAVCFSGDFAGLKVNVWDYSKSKQVPVPGLFRFGEQVMRPEPAVYADQELTAMTLLIYRDDREHSDWDEMHDFRLMISFKGWEKPLEAAGECPLRVTDKPIEGSVDQIEANTTTLFCGIDCDGGGMGVERVAGTREVNFRFDPMGGGLRMSGGCSGGSFHVGGDAKPYDEALIAARKPPVSFRLAPMAPAACAAFRKATDEDDGDSN